MTPVFVTILNFHSLGGRYTLPSAECSLETVPFPQYPGAEAPSPAMPSLHTGWCLEDLEHPDFF